MPPSVASTSSLSSLAGIHNVLCYYNATLIHLIDGKCHITIKKLKSYRTGLTGYYGYISYELILIPLKGIHT